jgi:hypothetical protein
MDTPFKVGGEGVNDTERRNYSRATSVTNVSLFRGLNLSIRDWCGAGSQGCHRAVRVDKNPW